MQHGIVQPSSWSQCISERNGGADFVPQRIDDKSGVGVQVTAADVNGDGRVDILTVSKLGAFLFVKRSDGDLKKLPANSAPAAAP